MKFTVDPIYLASAADTIRAAAGLRTDDLCRRYPSAAATAETRGKAPIQPSHPATKNKEKIIMKLNIQPLYLASAAAALQAAAGITVPAGCRCVRG